MVVLLSQNNLFNDKCFIRECNNLNLPGFVKIKTWQIAIFFSNKSRPWHTVDYNVGFKACASTKVLPSIGKTV